HTSGSAAFAPLLALRPYEEADIMVHSPLLVALLAVGSLFMGTSLGFVPVSPPRCSSWKPTPPASAATGDAPTTGAPIAMGMLAGLLVAFMVPRAALAGTGGARPDFQVVRPGYMQGIDAANAASKPGEIDYVTRSRLEAAQFPKAIKELELERTTLAKAPTKQQRLEKVQQQLEEYNKSLDYSKASVVE
ncbi:unnamed protein product, partial [Symbiodinium microadriaticum]